ncbi:hypothetical protein EYF80_014300 [Liparis tanakae]|uniref:Uncharacterized protein n=1 Tax=Liparis tanakae TaxID=230148 RepID=A0A4Z2IBU9_9TELE|nr:hypothetical protein EYF80_014300 [Liparis tanakae]
MPELGTRTDWVRTSKASLITAALQYARNGGQARVFLHLHLVFAALVNDIAQSAGGGALHLLVVAAQERQELPDPTEVVHLQTRADY